MADFLTEQESFWAGEFGNGYIERNQGEALLSSNVHMFSRIFSARNPGDSVLELGANIGLNLQALSLLFPSQRRVAVEINEQAQHTLLSRAFVDEAFLASALAFETDEKFDLVLCKGFLIHVNPDQLGNLFRKIASFSKRYVLFVEYYSREPQTIDYRGHQEKLFSRNFAADFLASNKEFALVDYGFFSEMDERHPEDSHYFLMEISTKA